VGVRFSAASPSIATRSFAPSAVNVIISGTAPTATLPRIAPSLARNTTLPGPVFGLAIMAAATIPFLTATLLIEPPNAARFTFATIVGVVGLLRLMMSSEGTPPAFLVTYSRRVLGS